MSLILTCCCPERTCCLHTGEDNSLRPGASRTPGLAELNTRLNSYERAGIIPMDYREQVTELHPPPRATPEHRLGQHRCTPDEATAVCSQANCTPLGETLKVVLCPAQFSLSDTAGLFSQSWGAIWMPSVFRKKLWITIWRVPVSLGCRENLCNHFQLTFFFFFFFFPAEKTVRFIFKYMH